MMICLVCQYRVTDEDYKGAVRDGGGSPICPGCRNHVWSRMTKLNMRQLTDLLGLDRATIYRWIQNGVFPHPSKRDGASFWDLQACLDAIAENQLRVRIPHFLLSQYATKTLPLS